VSPDRTVFRHPSQREADRGRLGRALGWYQRWGLLLTGLWLIGVSLAVLVVAVAFVRSQQTTERNARVACVRGMQIGPWIVKDYEQRQALPSSVLEQYRKLIPKTCD
jgi:hypothetical protein